MVAANFGCLDLNWIPTRYSVGAIGALVGLVGFRNADDFLKLFKKQS